MYQFLYDASCLVLAINVCPHCCLWVLKLRETLCDMTYTYERTELVPQDMLQIYFPPWPYMYVCVMILDIFYPIISIMQAPSVNKAWFLTLLASLLCFWDWWPVVWVQKIDLQKKGRDLFLCLITLFCFRYWPYLERLVPMSILSLYFCWKCVHSCKKEVGFFDSEVAMEAKVQILIYVILSLIQCWTFKPIQTVVLATNATIWISGKHAFHQNTPRVTITQPTDSIGKAAPTHIEIWWILWLIFLNQNKIFEVEMSF